MKITIKTTPDSLSLELTEVTGEALTELLDPSRAAILKHPAFDPETGTLETELHSFEEFEAFGEAFFDAIEDEVDKKV